MGITVIEKKAIIMKVNKGLKDFFKELRQKKKREEVFHSLLP